VRAQKALAERVERRGADVAEHDSERADGEHPERARRAVDTFGGGGQRRILTPLARLGKVAHAEPITQLPSFCAMFS
jgi:hypothetical protein